MAQAQVQARLKMARPMIPQKQAVAEHIPPCDGARAGPNGHVDWYFRSAGCDERIAATDSLRAIQRGLRAP